MSLQKFTEHDYMVDNTVEVLYCHKYTIDRVKYSGCQIGHIVYLHSLDYCKLLQYYPVLPFVAYVHLKVQAVHTIQQAALVRMLIGYYVSTSVYLLSIQPISSPQVFPALWGTRMVNGASDCPWCPAPLLLLECQRQCCTSAEPHGVQDT